MVRGDLLLALSALLRLSNQASYHYSCLTGAEERDARNVLLREPADLCLFNGDEEELAPHQLGTAGEASTIGAATLSEFSAKALNSPLILPKLIKVTELDCRRINGSHFVAIQDKYVKFPASIRIFCGDRQSHTYRLMANDHWPTFAFTMDESGDGCERFGIRELENKTGEAVANFRLDQENRNCSLKCSGARGQTATSADLLIGLCRSCLRCPNSCPPGHVPSRCLGGGCVEQPRLVPSDRIDTGAGRGDVWSSQLVLLALGTGCSVVRWRRRADPLRIHLQSDLVLSVCWCRLMVPLLMLMVPGEYWAIPVCCEILSGHLLLAALLLQRPYEQLAGAGGRPKLEMFIIAATNLSVVPISGSQLYWLYHLRQEDGFASQTQHLYTLRRFECTVLQGFLAALSAGFLYVMNADLWTTIVRHGKEKLVISAIALVATFRDCIEPLRVEPRTSSLASVTLSASMLAAVFTLETDRGRIVETTGQAA